MTVGLDNTQHAVDLSKLSDTTERFDETFVTGPELESPFQAQLRLYQSMIGKAEANLGRRVFGGKLTWIRISASARSRLESLRVDINTPGVSNARKQRLGQAVP